MLVTIRLLRYSLTRKATARAQNIEYVRRSLDSKMRTIAADMDGQRLAQGPMDGGTAIISSGLHASPTCPDNHITVRFFVSTGEYAAVAHIFEKADPEYFLAAKDRTSLKWKNTKLHHHLSSLEPWVGRWSDE